MESDELIAILREVRERVRSRYPGSSAGASGISLPDLQPLARARDAALGKAASIGTVNPRRGGPLNALVQGWKRLVARTLDWHVREQVIFNRQAVTAIDAALEALVETNRALAQLGDRIAVAEELKDIRAHWADWRSEWEHKLQQNEIQFLRSVADLQAGFSHRADLMDANYRDTARAQHADFSAALARSNAEIQNQLLANMERVKLDYERLIHSELRLIRQRLSVRDSAVEPGFPANQAGGAASALDYTRFAERFRGPEEHVKAGQRVYVPYFAGQAGKPGSLPHVLDIGCGRGEFLELLREAGVPATGIDVNPECVAMCREKGLEARTADLFAYLAELPEESLEGIFCAQVVEHLPPECLPEMIKLCATRLAPGGVIAVETPNPECLASLAKYFYLDPTHARPVPAQLLRFHFEENGIEVVEILKLSPAKDSMPSLASLPEDFREAFFGGLDYGIIGRKL